MYMTDAFLLNTRKQLQFYCARNPPSTSHSSQWNICLHYITNCKIIQQK